MCLKASSIERSGTNPEIAQLLTDTLAPLIETANETLKKIVTSWNTPVCTEDRDSTSLCILLFTAYMPAIVQLLSQSIKSASPNMKKKKDPAFDTFRQTVTKGLKELIGQFKGYFEGLTEYFKSQTALLEFDKEDWSILELLALKNSDLLKHMEKRLSHVNSEYKFTMDRLRDTCERLSKRYDVYSKNFN